MIDWSLSDESHAQHDDSCDQDLDEEHRIGSRHRFWDGFCVHGIQPFRDASGYMAMILSGMALYMPNHVPDPIPVTGMGGGDPPPETPGDMSATSDWDSLRSRSLRLSWSEVLRTMPCSLPFASILSAFDSLAFLLLLLAQHLAFLFILVQAISQEA